MVKKPFFFLILISFSSLSFSQKSVSTKEFPYQVLFVEDATVFGREVRQFDYLSNSDLLSVNGSITIFRYDYKMFELLKGRYWLDELVNERPEKNSYRPVLNPKEFYLNPVSPIGVATCPSYSRIDLIVPSGEKHDFYWEDEVELGWVITEEEDNKLYQKFTVEFFNLYDDLVRSIEVKGHSLIFKADTLDSNTQDDFYFDEGLMIVKIKAKFNHDFSTGQIGIMLHNQDSIIEKRGDYDYTGLRNAIYFDNIQDINRADFLYREQVRKSNQDPRFIALYEDFLARNPEFKESSE